LRHIEVFDAGRVFDIDARHIDAQHFDQWAEDADHMLGPVLEFGHKGDTVDFTFQQRDRPKAADAFHQKMPEVAEQVTCEHVVAGQVHDIASRWHIRFQIDLVGVAPCDCVFNEGAVGVQHAGFRYRPVRIPLGRRHNDGPLQVINLISNRLVKKRLCGHGAKPVL